LLDLEPQQKVGDMRDSAANLRSENGTKIRVEGGRVVSTWMEVWG